MSYESRKINPSTDGLYFFVDLLTLVHGARKNYEIDPPLADCFLGKAGQEIAIMVVVPIET